MILLFDPNPATAAETHHILHAAGYAAEAVSTPDAALVRLNDAPFDLALLALPGADAPAAAHLGLLRRIRAHHPDLPVVVSTGWEALPLATAAVRAGAADFITYPCSSQRVVRCIRSVLAISALKAGIGGLRPLDRATLDDLYHLEGINGRNPRFLELLDLAGRAAATDSFVLVSGEHGTGKALVAQILHHNGPRRDGPLVSADLSTLPPAHFERDLYGFASGDGYGGSGLFEQARGGTLILNAVDTLDASAQKMLLRVLQGCPAATPGQLPVTADDVRVVATSHRPLARLVASGAFREDLFYRLNLITIHLPPLRERRDDIPVLARHFLDQAAARHGRTASFTPDALHWLRAQHWPGNVRQLRELIEHTVMAATDARLTAAHFGVSVAESARPVALPDVGAMTLDEMEKAMIEKTMRHYGGNISQVASTLGLSRAALYRRFEKHGICVVKSA